jgi:hypothetical protein
MCIHLAALQINKRKDNRESKWLNCGNHQRPGRGFFKLLENKRNLLYIKTQSVPRCKNFPPRLFKDQR